MKAYVAAAWTRRDEARQLACTLREMGISVESRWLYESPCLPDASLDTYLKARSLEDVGDILAADILIRLSDKSLMAGPTCPSALVSGSRMAETMLAWYAGKHVVVLGGHQMIFDYLPGIRVVNTEEELKEYITQGLNFEKRNGGC